MATDTSAIRAGALSEKKVVGPWREAFGRLLRNRLAVVGLILVILAFTIAIFGPYLAPFPYAAQDLKGVLANGGRPVPPGVGGHILGTDQLGRDLFSRLLDGAQISMTVAIVVQVVVLGIGVPVGAIAGWFGGRWDTYLMRLTDVIYAFPDLLFIILLSVAFRETVFGQALNGLFLVFFAIGLTSWVTVARLVRGQLLSLKETEFVEAARAIGVPDRKIIIRHLIPNGLGPIIVAITLGIPGAILSEATLAYIGVGVQPPRASWGSLVAEGQKYVRGDSHLALFPALAIALALISFTFLGDGLRDALDPKLKGEAVVVAETGPAEEGASVIDLPPGQPAAAAALAGSTRLRADGTPASLLEVTDLSTHFFTRDGVVKAVDRVSFEVGYGETLGLVGESGCGKSVTALSVTRLVPDPPGKIVGGQIMFDGMDVLGLDDFGLRQLRGKEIGFIFQDPLTSLNPTLTIGYQIAEPIREHLKLSKKAAADRVVELLSKVGIPRARERLNDYPHQFSGGMRQRVMIAIALSCDPKLILADEPTTALDVTIQAQILELIKTLSQEFRTAVLLITHDLGIAAGMCDRINVMYAGRIVETGSVSELFEGPRMPYTWGLLDSLPRIDDRHGARLRSIEGMPPLLIDVPDSCHFAPRCVYAHDICREAEPELSARSAGGHRARCWATEPQGWIK